MSDEEFLDDVDEDVEEDEIGEDDEAVSGEDEDVDGNEDEDNFYDEEDDEDFDSTDATATEKSSILLQRDINEATRLGYSAGYHHHAFELIIWVAMDVDFVNAEKASCCGFYSDRKLVLKLVFSNPALYMSECPSVSNKRIQIRQTNDTDWQKSKLTDNQTFGLWWTLEQRVSEYLQGIWPSLVEEAQHNIANIDPTQEDNLEQIMGVGDITDRDFAAFALKNCKNDVESAVSLFLDEAKRKQLKKEYDSQKKSNLTSSSEGRSRKGNLLVRAMEHIKDRIDICSRYCVVCNKEHPLELLKPTVCGDDFCNFQFVDLGLGINVESEIMHAPEAVDLLICFTCAATSGRHFAPFPTSVRTKKLDATGQEKTYEFKTPGEVGSALQALPSVADMQKLIVAGKLKDALEELNPLLYKLLRWVLGTNRAHLQKIDKANQIKGLDVAAAQFIMKSSPPVTERRFQVLKKEHEGSFYAFHGSAFSNWHSILRNGLKNYSNTEFMTTGAVYGPGIYMATDSGTSLGYTGSQAGEWKNSMFGSNMACMALCEVIEYGTSHQCLGRLHRPNCSHNSSAPYYRCEAEEFVCTRFLFLFGSARNANVKAAELNIPNSLRHSFKNLKTSSHGMDAKD